jgi:N-carbamoyl-L-amino-acid hydrolase
MMLEPNAPSVIPGRAEIHLQFRDADPAYLDACEASLFTLAAEVERAGPCRIEIEPLARSAPRPMDLRFQALIEAAAERHAPSLHLRMPSAAGHDAAVLAERMPAGMMFVPSLSGVSHHWSEDTSEDDIILGAQVFADAAFRILRNADRP